MRPKHISSLALKKKVSRRRSKSIRSKQRCGCLFEGANTFLSKLKVIFSPFSSSLSRFSSTGVLSIWIAVGMTSDSTQSDPSKTARLPWTEKYRPSTLQEVVAHENVVGTLQRLMDSGNMPHLLLYGPPGTGKTTTVRACAAHLFGQSQMRADVLELNASDDRGIDAVRNLIKEFCSTSSVFSLKPSSSSFKLVVLDEADHMSHDAQAALRRIVEKFTKNVRFCILCNHVNKIIPALQSRCTRFRFAPVKKKEMLPRLRHVMTSEGVSFSEDGLVAAYVLSKGDLRRCLNTMQASFLSFNEVTESSVYKVTGNATPLEVSNIIHATLSSDFTTSWRSMESLVSASGVCVADLVRDVYPIVMSMELPQDCKRFLLLRLSDLEYYSALGSRESVGLSGLLAAFQIVKEAVTRQVPLAALCGR